MTGRIIIGFLSVLIILPIVLIFYKIIVAPQTNTELLWLKFGKNELLNTLLLLTATLFISLITGVISAWLVSRYSFYGSKHFSWLLAMPLAIPAYIMAYTQQGTYGYTGSISTFFRNTLGTDFSISFMNMTGLIIVLSMVLYPYIYLAARANFTKQSVSYIYAAQSLRKNSLWIFINVATPLARPAIVAGCLLVCMEVLNDYGAASYLGVKTFTTAIFGLWEYDLNVAVVLSFWLVLFVLVIVSIENYLRKNKRYIAQPMSNKLEVIELKGKKNMFAFLFCFTLLLFTFFIPVLQLLIWTFKTWSKVVANNFAQTVWNSFVLGFWATLFILAIAMFIGYINYTTTRKNNLLSNISGIGYAIPGTVIAVVVMLIPKQLTDIFSENSYIYELFFTGSFILLIYAYIVRFYAVGKQNIESGFESYSDSLHLASRSLGASTIKTFFMIHLPMLKNTLIISAILIFVDVIKELPLTLILRPFNFNTLATKAYDYAKINESVAEAAPASLLIIALGIIPVFILNKYLSK